MIGKAPRGLKYSFANEQEQTKKKEIFYISDYNRKSVIYNHFLYISYNIKMMQIYLD